MDITYGINQVFSKLEIITLELAVNDNDKENNKRSVRDSAHRA